jgi:chitin disaccharide deacetylase
MVSLAAVLGYSPDARVLIPHVDDVGVCHGANRAFVELAEQGFVTTGSVMVPCPWFPEIVELASEQPELDLGVHVTLTSESRACRWRPISTASRDSGLMDHDGYFWPNVADLRRNADRTAVEKEMRAQIEAAYAAGLDVTHLDAHMGAAAAPEFLESYLALGRRYRLPVLLPRRIGTYLSVLEIGPVEAGAYARVLNRLSGEGVPLIDAFAMGIGMRQRPCEQTYRHIVEVAVPGVTYLSLHCSIPGEVERLHPNDAHWRIAEYELFAAPGFTEWLETQEVHLIGFRAIRELYQELPTGA